MLTLAAEKDSVAAAFEVSYRYLDPGQQRVLPPASACTRAPRSTPTPPPPWPVPACRRPPGYLDALHGEGLLTEAGYRRYGMHDLIRRYARDHAAADPAAGREQALDRLLDYYQHTAALAEARLARQARTSPAPAPPAPPAAVPDLPDRTGRWRGHGPNAPTCSPASTTPPAPASMPGSSP